MTLRACIVCGHPLPELAKFCGQCGSLTETGPSTNPSPPVHDRPPPTQDEARPRPAQGMPLPNQTIVEFRPGTVPGGAPAPVPAAAPPPQAVQAATNKKTMIGVSAEQVFAAAMQPPQPAFPATAQAPMPPPDAQALFDPRSEKRTMMGVAMPGIAPTSPFGAPGGSPALPQKSGTMMGVAIPGIAPLRASPGGPQPYAPRQVAPTAPPHVDIVPAPPPLEAEPMPAAPVVPRKRGGMSLAVAAILAALILAGGGVAIALVLLKSVPFTAEARRDTAGKEILHLSCEGCEDGTTVELNGASATFSAKAADLPLSVPLKVGDNPLALRLDRPGSGRDETVNVTVPLAFRIFPDLSTLDGPRPEITVRVEALPGSEVRLDDKVVELDAAGKGSYAIDVSKETEGPNDTSVNLEKAVPFVVSSKEGGAHEGKVTAPFRVVPLNLDAPGLSTVVESPSFVVLGRASGKSQITVNGNAAAVERGHFEATVDAPAPGDIPYVVRAGGLGLGWAPRTIHRTLRRVVSFADEAKAREAQTTPGYDALVADLLSNAGHTQPVVVEGDVLSVRVDGHRTSADINDRRGCAKSPCHTRVTWMSKESLASGDSVRAFGRATAAQKMGDGNTLLDVEADFVVPAPKKAEGRRPPGR